MTTATPNAKLRRCSPPWRPAIPCPRRAAGCRWRDSTNAAGLRSQVMTTAVGSRLVRLDNGECRALVYPEQGFQLRGFAAPVAGRAGGAPIEAIAAPVDAREPADRRYGNPVLFPSVGVTHGAEPDRWSHGGRLLPMPQHGLARDAYWHVEAFDDQSITGVLAPTTGIRAGFPFSFELRLRYALAGAALVFTAELANRGDEPFPYAFGLTRTCARRSATRRAGRLQGRLPAGIRLRSSDSWRTIERAPAAAAPSPHRIRSCQARSCSPKPAPPPSRSRTPRRGRHARLRRRQRDQLSHLGAVERQPRRPLRLSRALDRRAQRAEPPRHAHDRRGATHRYRMTISLHAL